MPAPSAPAVFTERLIENIGRVFLGKPQAMQLAAITLIAEGHLLIEDYPGVGKTLLARSLARSLDLPFQRLQCTADLLPADVLGANVYQPATGEIGFRPGPVFTSVLVADELNRTPPRTQSALLQCMQERRVTIDRTTHELPDPFFVIATQNPQAFAGTYPLPESQLDRFLMRIRLGYLDPASEAAVVARGDGFREIDDLSAVADAQTVRDARTAARAVVVDKSIVAYIVDLAQRTRAHGEVRIGVSTRGAQALFRAVQARALLHRRTYATPEDAHALVGPVFCHRISAASGHNAPEAIVHEIVASTPLPE